MHIHTYIHTYMCVECWVDLHVHYGTHTSRRSCFLQHYTRNALTVFLAYLKPQMYVHTLFSVCSLCTCHVPICISLTALHYSSLRSCTICWTTLCLLSPCLFEGSGRCTRKWYCKLSPSDAARHSVHIPIEHFASTLVTALSLYVTIPYTSVV